MVEFVEGGYVIKVPSSSPAEEYASLMHALLECMKIAEKNTEEERYWIGNLLQAMQLDDSQVRKVTGEENNP